MNKYIFLLLALLVFLAKAEEMKINQPDNLNSKVFMDTRLVPNCKCIVANSPMVFHNCFAKHATDCGTCEYIGSTGWSEKVCPKCRFEGKVPNIMVHAIYPPENNRAFDKGTKAWEEKRNSIKIVIHDFLHKWHHYDTNYIGNIQIFDSNGMALIWDRIESDVVHGSCDIHLGKRHFGHRVRENESKHEFGFKGNGGFRKGRSQHITSYIKFTSLSWGKLVLKIRSGKDGGCNSKWNDSDVERSEYCSM